MTRRARPTRVLAALGAGTLALATLGAGVTPARASTAAQGPPAAPASIAPPAAAPAAPAALAWVRCGGAQCATLPVPLDYNDPSKGTIELVFARRPADDQSRKLGVIFVNPGGPGSSAIAALPAFASILGRSIRQRFDIVAVEPRGVGSETAICEGKPGDPWPQESATSIFPYQDDQYEARLAADAALRAMCAASNPRILPYMSTADVARDMDRVREALGAQTISYVGVSYGTFLGTTYAQLFPARVRAMVLDGVVDPVAWSTGRGSEAATRPVTERLGSGVSAHESLFAAFDECADLGERYCAEYANIREDWEVLTTSLRKQPFEIGPGFAFTYDLLIGLTTQALYDAEAIPELLSLVSLLRTELDRAQADPAPDEQRVPAASTLRAYQRVIRRDQLNRKTRIGYDPPAPPVPVEEQMPPMWAPLFEGVTCSETNNPSRPWAWVESSKRTDARAPGFGPFWTWMSSACAQWPAKAANAYRGPFTARPATPLLLMSTMHDPATPRTGAVALQRLSPGSRLVTLDGWGHAVLDASGCATSIREAYLVNRRLPAANTTCSPDHPLFTQLG